ncbi:MAG: polysaccharide biosynthesis/export family protein [Candidatus Didemnitutus sp.]|nr:polysaccharide biosynthesis/export family protein [Candidatus Didemnitutus sp.]
MRPPCPFFSTLLLCALAVVSGCESTGGRGALRNPKVDATISAAQLRPGDALTVTLSGIPDPSTNTVQIDEQGSISLQFIGVIPAAGLNTGELANAIRTAYIDRKFYTSISVSVTVTERYVYIGGEVQRPGRIPWSPDLTLAKAVQSAGGFTLYAKEGKITLTRDRRAYDFDVRLAQREPLEDPLLFPGDSIQVPRSAF